MWPTNEILSGFRRATLRSLSLRASKTPNPLGVSTLSPAMRPFNPQKSCGAPVKAGGM
jgi:hypothetical protein